jgi:Tol biopolymer transport system component
LKGEAVKNRAALFVISALAILLVLPGVASASLIELASLANNGAQGNDNSIGVATISGYGRYVAFWSVASNLVLGDSNGRQDIFLRDRFDGTTVRVSVNSGGTQGDGNSYSPSINADGRYVVFTSSATNLVPGDANGFDDVFLRDLDTGTTSRVSAGGGGEADNNSGSPDINGMGRYVVFDSAASNLVVGDTNNGFDIFLRDVVMGSTARVSVSGSGVQANSDSYSPSISADGRYVAFSSDAYNLVANDTNAQTDIFVRDVVGGATTRVSVSSSGGQGNSESWGPSLSADGRYVAFSSYAGNLVSGDSNAAADVFVHDMVTGATTLVSLSSAGVQGNSASEDITVSADGRYASFESAATNLVSGDTNGEKDVFIRDRVAGTTRRVSVSSNGVQGNSDGLDPSISPDGGYVVFYSSATNLYPGDINDKSDVFVARPLAYTSLRGTDRYDTAIKLSQAAFPTALPPNSGLVLAPGETFQEALCGAPLAAAFGGPVLLTYQNALANNVKAELQRLAPANVFCIGMSDAVVNAVAAALPGATVTPVTGGVGNSVYVMSYRVAKVLGAKIGADMSNAAAIITRGDVFPDAIGVSPLACAMVWPVLLTESGGSAPLNASSAAALSELGITHAIKVGTYVTLPGGVTGLANLSGADRYYTNRNVAEWSHSTAGLLFTHIGIATGDKFPDALAAGPYLAKDGGILLLSPLNGPLPTCIGAEITANRAAVCKVSFIACVEPVISQVKALLP